jgi:transposase
MLTLYALSSNDFSYVASKPDKYFKQLHNQKISLAEVMTTRNFLNSKQREYLQTAMRRAECPRLREHALILLLKNDGKTYAEIADFIGCGYTTVAYWCVHGDPDNLESLKDQRKQGNYQKATDRYVQKLLEVIQVEPQTLGCNFKYWSLQRLSNYLVEQTDIRLSSAQISRILKRKKCPYPQIGSNLRYQKRLNSSRLKFQFRCNAVGIRVNRVLQKNMLKDGMT